MLIARRLSLGFDLCEAIKIMMKNPVVERFLIRGRDHWLQLRPDTVDNPYAHITVTPGYTRVHDRVCATGPVPDIFLLLHFVLDW